MKNQLRYSIILLTSLFFSFNTKAQTVFEDVVYLKNGSIIHGMIIEQIPNKSIKIQTKDENIFVCSLDEILKITKEEENSPTNNYSGIDYNRIKKSGYINITELNFAFGIGDIYRGYNAYGIQTVNGYLYTSRLSFGVGAGLLIDAHEGTALIPLFADLRIYFLEQKPITPFITIDLGYSLCTDNNNKGGFLINPSLGIKAYASSKAALHFSIGYLVQSDTRSVSYYNYTRVNETVETGYLNFKMGVSF